MNLLLLLGILMVAGIIGGMLVQNAGSGEEEGLLKKFDSVGEMRSYLRENGALSGPYEKYRLTTWQGAYVFRVTPESGFILKGTVTHDTGEGSPWYWGSAGAVRRSLSIEDVLYTISEQCIIMSDLENPWRTINEIVPRYPPPNIGE
jgi:hypothetical protein